MKRGALLALALAAGLVALRQGRLDRPGSYDRFTLPAYDAYAYVAMAERPAVFTVAPWGYRILTPLAARALSPRDVVRGFRWLTLAGLALSGAALYAFLRRLGHAPGAALSGVAFLCLCGAAGEVIGYPFLVEPLALLLQIVFLLAVESGARAGVLAFVSALAASNKELQLLMLPVVFTARVSQDGVRAALLKTAASAAGALATVVLLRWWWAPVASLPRLPAADAWRPLLGALWALRGEALAGLLLSGLLPLAIAGALLPRSRTYLRRYGLLVLTMLAFPFAAFLNVGEARPPVLFGKNTDRLLLFAVPVLLPLALHAVAAMLRRPTAEPAPDASVSPRWSRAGWVATAVCLLALGFGLDRYRRADLRGSRDGPLLLALCRESLRVAGRLERGGDVAFAPASMRYRWGIDHPSEMARMRWFLRDGWGDLPHYAEGDARTVAPEATLLLPCFRPRALAVELALDAARPTPIGVRVNAMEVATRLVGPGVTALALDVPAEALFRGDNRLTITLQDPADAVTLRRVAWRSPVIHTVGHSTRALADFVALLREGDVRTLVDVRRQPFSRRHPQFSRDALARSLADAGIAYVHEVDLGGHREPRPDSPNTAWRPDALRGYADNLASPAFQAALDRVAALEHAAVMCAEANPQDCHRQILADALVVRGLVVRHLLAPGRTEDHALHPRATLRDGVLVYPAAGQLRLG